MTTTEAEIPGLRHLPVSVFAVAMGVLGLALALSAAETALDLPRRLATAGLIAGALVLAAVALAYAAKALRHPQAVVAEWRHPVRLAFFPAISIAFLLMAAALVEPAPDLARALFLPAAGLQGALAVAVIGAWIGPRSFAPGSFNPAWFIPAVGNVVVPLAGARLGYMDLSWAFFAAGMVFWVALLPPLLHRLVFGEPLAPRMVPTLAILFAPPAVGFVALTRLTGDAGMPGIILLNAGYAMALIAATQAPRLRGVPFALSFWALTFPLAALAVASLLHARLAASVPHLWIGLGLTALLAGLVAVLLARTVAALADGRLLRLEEGFTPGAPSAPQPAR